MLSFPPPKTLFRLTEARIYAPRFAHLAQNSFRTTALRLSAPIQKSIYTQVSVAKFPSYSFERISKPSCVAFQCSFFPQHLLEQQQQQQFPFTSFSTSPNSLFSSSSSPPLLTSNPPPASKPIKKEPKLSSLLNEGGCLTNIRGEEPSPSTSGSSDSASSASAVTSSTGSSPSGGIQVEEEKFSNPVLYWLQGYASLSKFRLSALVLSTTMFGFYMAPATSFLWGPFVWSSIGTGLTICSANSINQLIEVPNDSRMLRTKKRWLPTGRMSQLHAKSFAVLSGAGGFGLLYAFVNPLAAYLALGNLFLYTAVYTPMKQRHPFNTWVGAIVGAIPPMIGWAAATGGHDLSAGAWVLGGLLTVWQMPHFMALSYALKDDYQRGGFKMLINVRPEKVPGVVLRYSLGMLALGPASWWAGLTTEWFVLDSMIPSGYLVYLASQFYRRPDSTEARKVFRYTLSLLPILMGLMMLHQKTDDKKVEEVEEGVAAAV